MEKSEQYFEKRSIQFNVPKEFRRKIAMKGNRSPIVSSLRRLNRYRLEERETFISVKMITSFRRYRAIV